MNRHEQRKNAARQYCITKPMIDAFHRGAKWADKTMIEKACQWITEHIDIPYEGRMIDGEPEAADYIEWAKERLRCAEEVAEAFRKAMEE